MKIDKTIEYFNYRLETLKRKRTNYEPKWQELAIFCDPRNAYFNVKKTNGDLSQLIPKTDDTVQLYLPMYAAIMNSMLTPQAYLWHQQKFFNQQLQDEFGDFLSMQNQLLFDLRYSGLSNFLSAINEAYISLAIYGHAILQLKPDRKTKRINYQTLPIKEFYIDKDFTGFINVFYRVVETTYKNLISMFPGYIPEKFKNRNDSKWLDDNVSLLHAFEPSNEESGKFDSVYIDLNDKVIIEKTVLDQPRYLCVRSSVFPSSDDPYGFSPCMSILPSIKALNALQFNFIKQTDNAGQPTLLTNSDVIDATKVSANGTVVEGGIDDEGRPMVKALDLRSDYPALDYQIKQLQDKIKQALFINFSLSFSDTQSRSATDATIKLNEKANMIAPSGDRVCRELLIPMIELELALYDDMGMLPPVPQEVIGKNLPTEFDIRLDNPMLKGQRMDSATNIMTLAQWIGQLLPLDGNAGNTFNVDRSIRTLKEIMNVPNDVVNTPRETNAITSAKEAAQSQQVMVESAPKIAGAVKDLADAKAKVG